MVPTRLLSSHLMLELEVHRAGHWDGVGGWDSSGRARTRWNPLARGRVRLLLPPVRTALKTWGRNGRSWRPSSRELVPPVSEVGETNGGAEGRWHGCCHTAVREPAEKRSHVCALPADTLRTHNARVHRAPAAPA